MIIELHMKAKDAHMTEAMLRQRLGGDGDLPHLINALLYGVVLEELQKSAHVPQPAPGANQ